MANNPFYPGYTPGKPTEDPVGPLYPGYYAGQALPRKPLPKNFIKPIQYDVDAYMQNIDDAAREVLLAPFAGPRWLLERIISDWKDRFKASVKPKDIPVTELDDYSTEDFPGVVVSLSLNPEDWKKDPKKQALKTARSWVKEATGLNLDDLSDPNFSDIENKTNRELWQNLYWHTNQPDVSLGGRASKAISERLEAQGGDLITPRPDPMNLRNVNIPGVDYEKAVTAMGGFVEQRDNPRTREKNRNDYLYETSTAIANEVNARIKDPSYANFSNQYEGAIGAFNIRNGILDDIRGKNGLSKGIKNTTEILEKSILGQKDEYTGRQVTPAAAWTELKIALRNADSNRKTRLNDARDLFNRGKIDENTFKRMTSRLDDLEQITNHVKETLKTINTSSTAAVSEQRAAKEKIEKAINGGLTGKSLTGGQTFTPSIEGSILGDQNAALVNPGLGGIGALIADDTARSAGLDLHARKLIPALNRLNGDRVRFATKEVLESWDKEKLLENYVYNRFTKVLSERTTGAFIENRLKRNNYYGLIVTPEGTPSWRDPEKLARFQKRYAYKVGMKLDPATYGVSKIVLTAGSHFGIIEDNLFKKFDLSNTGDYTFLQSIIDGTYNKDALARRLFGHNKSYSNLNKKELRELKLFLRKSKGYKDWLKTQKKTFGNSRVTDSAFAVGFLRDLAIKNNPKSKDGLNAGYNLTREYIGRLEKIQNSLTTLQAKWEASIFGKSIKFAQQWRTIVSEKIGKVFANLLTKLLGAAAAASGLGMALQAVIEFAARKAIEYSEAWIKGIINWDFEDLAKMFNRDMAKLMKSCLVVFTVFVLISVIPMWFVFGIIGSSISPVDPTVGNSNLGYGNNPLGENDVVKVRKSAIVTVRNSDGSTSTLTDPSQISNDQVAGATIKYVINISPRITITDGSVSYADSPSIRGSENSTNSRPLSGLSYTSLKEFKEGKGIKIDLPSITLTGADKDSLLMNTVAVDTPAVPTEGIEADSVSWSVYTRIGNYTPECPVMTTPEILTLSYGIPGSHGTPEYCQNAYKGECPYSIPYTWGPSCKAGSCGYWGFALDVSDANNKTKGGSPVSLPTLGGTGITWIVIRTINNDEGFQGFEAKSSDGKWRISYTHIDNADTVVKDAVLSPGQIVGTLSNAAAVGLHKHVHIELFDVSGGGIGIPVRPEDYLCK